MDGSGKRLSWATVRFQPTPRLSLTQIASHHLHTGKVLRKTTASTTSPPPCVRPDSTSTYASVSPPRPSNPHLIFLVTAPARTWSVVSHLHHLLAPMRFYLLPFQAHLHRLLRSSSYLLFPPQYQPTPFIAIVLLPDIGLEGQLT